MRIINLTSHSRRGLAKCNGGILLIRRPGFRDVTGGIRRVFKSSGFFVFSDVQTLESPTIPLLLYLFQIKEIPAVCLLPLSASPHLHIFLSTCCQNEDLVKTISVQKH